MRARTNATSMSPLTVLAFTGPRAFVTRMPPLVLWSSSSPAMPSTSMLAVVHGRELERAAGRHLDLEVDRARPGVGADLHPVLLLLGREIEAVVRDPLHAAAGA